MLFAMELIWRIEMSVISKEWLEEGFDDRIKNYCELKNKIPLDGISAKFSEDINLDGFEKYIVKNNNKYYWSENIEFKNKLDDLKKREVVYIIYTDNFPFQKDSIETVYDDLKERDIAICRKNYEKTATKEQNSKWANIKKNTRYCLYVGGSLDFPSRLRQHLGYGPESTYSMQLNKWWEDAKIHIDVWDLSDITGEDSTKRQIIEDILWDKYDPLFGKKGAK